MFTENDFLHYFDQMQQIENKMRDTYQNLHDQLENPEYKKIFARMVNEEKAHYALIENLKGAFLQ